MNAPVPHVGARAQVTWSDGRVYPATVLAVSQGYAQVRWDAGGATQWVGLAALAPLGTPTQARGGSAPGPQRAPTAAAQPPVSAVPLAPVAVQQKASRTPETPARALPAQAPPGAPPRPTTGSLGGLPRGLVYEPTAGGPGDGKVFFVLFGFVATADNDQAMRLTDIEHLGDDVAALRASGYRVVVDLHGDLEVLDAALTGKHPDAAGAQPAGVFWGGHGDDDGTISTHDGGWIAPEQLAPEIAGQGTVKLFVMSACHAGSHTARWQKALGPGAQVIGWGAPITNARAIEFLVPDEANARGFDDLLEKHLGVRRVAEDGPLVEIKELAQKHDERLATLLLSVEELAQEAQKRLKCRLEKAKTTDSWFFEVRTPPSKDAPLVARSQIVRVTPMGVGAGWLNVWSIVGPYSDALDLARGMRAVAPSTHVRVTLAKLTELEGEFVVVETLVRRRRLDPYTFANMVRTIGVHADRLEDMYFGSDKR